MLIRLGCVCVCEREREYVYIFRERESVCLRLIIAYAMLIRLACVCVCIHMLSMFACACASSSGTRCSYVLPVPRLVLPRLAYQVEHQDKRIQRGVGVMTVRLPEMPLPSPPRQRKRSQGRTGAPCRALPAHTLSQLLASQLQRHPARVLVRG